MKKFEAFIFENKNKSFNSELRKTTKKNKINK